MSQLPRLLSYYQVRILNILLVFESTSIMHGKLANRQGPQISPIICDKNIPCTKSVKYINYIKKIKGVGEMKDGLRKRPNLTKYPEYKKYRVAKNTRHLKNTRHIISSNVTLVSLSLQQLKNLVRDFSKLAKSKFSPKSQSPTPSFSN